MGESVRCFLIAIYLCSSTLAYGHICSQWEYSKFNIVRSSGSSQAIWTEVGNRQEWDMLETQDVMKMNKYFDLTSFSHIYFLESLGNKGWGLATSNQQILSEGETINTMYFKRCKK